MSALIATDLDRTMIFSRSAAEVPLGDDDTAGATGPDAVCVEIYRDAPLSFMTADAVTAFAALAVRAPLVPVTTRTREQYERIALPGPTPRFAVVANGGRILLDGADDPAWRRDVEARVARESAPLVQVHADLLGRIDPSWVSSVRIADDLFVYLVVDTARQPADFAGDWQAWCTPRGWSVSQQGRKIYAMPTGVSKSGAVSHVRSRLIDDGALDADSPVLAAGDGRLDADLLEYADHAIRPCHGELHEADWTTPGLAVTTASGIAAGEEILTWFAARLASSSPVPDPAFAEK